MSGGEAKVLDIIQGDPKTAVAIVAAILAFISGVLGPLVQLIIGSKQAAAAQRAVDVTGSRAIATPHPPYSPHSPLLE